MSCSRWSLSMALPPGLLPGGPKAWACREPLHSLSSLHQGCTIVLQFEHLFQSTCLTVSKDKEGIPSLWPGSSLRFVNHVWLWEAVLYRWTWAPASVHRDTSDLAEVVLLVCRGIPRPNTRRGGRSASRWE